MKKIVSILVLLLAFSMNAQAQTEKKAQEKINPEAAAKSDLKALIQIVPSNGTDSYFGDLHQLFLKKHTDLNNATSDNQKKEVSKTIEAKLEASFTEEQIKQLKSVPGLYEKLIN